MLQVGKAEGTKRNEGFTLLELLMVMTIIALGATVMSISMRPARGLADLKSAAMNTASRFREARSAAINRHTAQVVLIDAGRRTIKYGRPRSSDRIDKDISLRVTAAASERLSASLSGIRFFPNGSSTGGGVRFERRGKAYEVRVNWLTGRVVVKPAG